MRDADTESESEAAEIARARNMTRWARADEAEMRRAVIARSVEREESKHRHSVRNRNEAGELTAVHLC